MHNYIVVRADLEPAQQVLRGLHAALVCRSVPDEDALVFLLAQNEKELDTLTSALAPEVFTYRYCEDDQLNAVAFRGVTEEQRRNFRKLKMWKHTHPV